MHEASIVRAIFESSDEIRKNEGIDRVTRVRIVVGGMHHLVPQVMRHYFDLMRLEWEGFNNAELDMKIVPVQVKCRKCGWSGEVEPPIFICEACGSFETDMTQGKDLFIETIQGETDDAERNQGHAEDSQHQ